MKKNKNNFLIEKLDFSSFSTIKKFIKKINRILSMDFRITHIIK